LLGQCVFEAVGAGVKAGDTVVCFGDSLTFGSGVKGAGTAEGEAYPAVLRRLFEQRGRAAPGTP
jgi:lysophospholipase L1-like esterase